MNNNVNIVEITKRKRIKQVKNESGTVCYNYLENFNKNTNKWIRIGASANLYFLLESFVDIKNTEKKEKLINFYKNIVKN